MNNLDIDISCARKTAYPNTQDIRLALLSSGCAVLKDENSATSNERAAENSARVAGIARWEPYPTVQQGQPQHSPNRFIEFLKWVQANWLSILGIILTILGLSWVARRIDRWISGKKIDVILTGLPSAGKTDLWTAWRDGMSPRSDAVPTVGAQRMVNLAPVPMNPYTIYPEIVDPAGSDPSLVIRQLQQKRRWSKGVLVVVLSPTRLYQSSSTGIAATNKEFILEQKGYMNLPLALSGHTKKLKPKVVILFITKFDLISDDPPYSKSNATVTHELEALFIGHRESLSRQCENAGIPFDCIVGSAKEGWGVRELREVIARKVVGAK